MKLSFIFFSVFFAGSVYAQLPITRSIFSGVFTPIHSGSGGGTLSTASGDDVTQDNLPIGFTFNYLGTNYTTMGVSTNGWASFVGALASTSQAGNVNLFSTAGPNLCLGPWWDDLASDSIVYQTTGTPGSQVFTIQWYARSYFSTSTQNISFQLKLFEGTNIIEFHYGAFTASIANTSESASIGIENTTGGPGNFIDAVTGSSFVGMGYMTAATKWPSAFFRFTPGASTPIAGGTYNVGSGQTYPTINEAVADINHRGMSGPILLSLTQSLYDVTPANGDNIFPLFLGPIAGLSASNSLTIQPASGTSTLSYNGETGGFATNFSSTSAFGTTTEPIIATVGANNIIFRNLYLTGAPGTIVDRGIAFVNYSANLGTSLCSAKNCTVSLDRSNTSSIGFETRTQVTPTVASGANSNNTFMDIRIGNVYNGILLSGNSTIPDVNNMITTSSPGLYNPIGTSTANDIGNGTSASYGIQAANQSNVTINNNDVRNITVNGSVLSDGIFLNALQGTSNVFNNKVMNIRNISTSATTGVTGIRANIATTGTHEIRVYNNFVSGISTAYTGAISATRQLKGIYIQSGGGGANTQTINVDFNSVSIDGSPTPSISSTCFEIGTSSGPVIKVRDNIFANFTGAQTSPARHCAWFSTSATTVGNTGSVSNYNDLYVPNATQGFIGIGNTTTYATLANWQTGVTQDANSQNCDPGFINNASDLHVTSICVDGMANMTGITWVTNDIDNTPRSSPPDIGADEVASCTTVSGGVHTINSFSKCNGQTASMNVVGSTMGLGITYQWQVSNTPGGPYSNVTGGAGANTTAYTTGTLATGNYYFVLLTTCTVSSVSASSSEATVVVNPIPSASITSNAPICEGQTLNLTGGTDVGTNFVWTGPNGFASASQNASISGALTSASGTYSLLVSTASCSAAVVTASLTINPVPTAITVTPVSASLCAGSSQSIIATGGDLPATFNFGTQAAQNAASTTASGYPAPYTVYYGGQRMQMLILASELSAAGFTTNSSIKSVQFPVVSKGSNWGGSLTSLQSFQVNIGMTPLTTMSAFQTGLTNVVAPMNYTPSVGYNNVHVFSSPLIWDGVSNVIIETTFSNNFLGGTNDLVVQYNSPTPSFTSTIVYRADSQTAAAMATTSTISFSYAARPDFKLNGLSVGSYTWSPSGSLSSSSSPTVTANPTSSTVYTVASALGSCSANASVSLNVVPVPTVAASASSPSICSGSSATLTGSGATSYTWSSGPTSATTVESPSVTTTYTVTGETSGCMGTDVVTVSVTASPTVSASASSPSVCSGSSATLTAVGATSYSWSTGGTTASIVESPTVNTTYTVTGDNAGCSDTALVSLTVNATPTVSAMAPVSTICAGNTVTLVATGATSYTWSTGAMTATTTDTPSVNTSYTVTGESGGCSDTASVSLIVNSNPVVNAVSSTSLICAGSSVTLTASGANTYTWSTGTTSAVTVETPTTTTSYTVTGEDVNGCMADFVISQSVSPCTGIEAAKGALAKVQVYPNPNNGLINVVIPNIENEPVFELYDALGKLVASVQLTENHNKVNVSGIAVGIYSYRIKSGNVIYDYGKLVRE